MEQNAAKQELLGQAIQDAKVEKYMREMGLLDIGGADSASKTAVEQQFVALDSDQDNEEYDAFLTFHDPELEECFLKQYNKVNISADIVNFSCMLALGVCFTVCVVAFYGMNEGLGLFTGCVMLTIIRLILISSKRSWYSENRSTLIRFMHILHGATAMLASRTIPMPEFRSPSYLILYLMRTPLMIQMMTGCGMIIPFKVHVFSHLLACFISSPWVYFVCSRCEDPLGAHKIALSPNFFTDVSEVITQWLQRSTIIGAVDEAFSNSKWYPVESDLPCWVPMLFIHVIVGYIVPSAIVYTLEAYYRFSFALQEQPELVRKLRKMKRFRGVVLLVLAVVAISAQCLWVLLLTAQNVMENAHVGNSLLNKLNASILFAGKTFAKP